MNQYYGAYPPQSLTPQQAAALGGWQNNQNLQQMHDEIVANRMADKDETIAQLRTQVSQMTLAASQQAQNNYLVNQLRPAPGPAYIVQNPYAGTGTLGCQIAGLTGCCNMAA